VANADFINSVYQTALQLGIPEVQARLAATQAALETNYGKSAPGNNYFGIKGSGQTLKTKEASNGALTAINDSFRTYPDLAGSVQGWWDQIQRNWPDAATATNFGTAIDALNNGRHGRYATDDVEKNDPLTYQDKLASINQRYLGGGPLPPANIPSVGTALDVTPPGAYTIKSGDTLGKIAQRYGTTVQQLAQANGISDPNKIRAGASLRIGAPPPLPASTFGGRLPAQAQYGVDRLVPGMLRRQRFRCWLAPSALKVHWRPVR
jgi:nucleoid-associated protein YgaU